MTPGIQNVLIVGAGVAGLALARVLRLNQMEFDLVECRRSDSSPGGAVLLTGNSVRVLDEIGLGRAVMNRGRNVSEIRFADQDGTLLFEFECPGRHRWPAFVSIRRSALQTLMLDGLQPLEPRWGTAVTAISETDDGVMVSLSDGTQGRYDLVVGADGVHSFLRRLLFDDRPITPIANFLGWRFMAPCPAHLQTPLHMLGNGCTLLLHPQADGTVYCGAGPVWGAEFSSSTDLDQLQASFSRFRGVAEGVLANLAENQPFARTHYWNLEQPTWHRGRCLLIGDAAHACAPTLAQGAAMALEDAFVLGEILKTEQDASTALELFEARRRPRVSITQQLSLERMYANRPSSDQALRIRNRLLNRFGATQLLDAWAPLMERSP